MSAASFLRYVQLAHFSHPRSERIIYRTIRRLCATSLVELGVGMGERATRMIRVALRYAGRQPVRYTGIDLFEARSFERPGWTIKRAHRVLRALGAKIQLVPGTPHSALARYANGLAGTDLIVVAADQDPESLAQAWFYVPRMLHAGSRVLIELPHRPDTKPGFRILGPVEVQQLAQQSRPIKNRAA